MSLKSCLRTIASPSRMRGLLAAMLASSMLLAPRLVAQGKTPTGGAPQPLQREKGTNTPLPFDSHNRTNSSTK